MEILDYVASYSRGRRVSTMQGYTATSVKSRTRNTLRCAIGIGMFMMATFFAPAALGSASTTYTYTGNLFTSAGGFYTTADSVTGFFTYSTLGDNFSGEIDPASYTFTDGVQTYDMSDSWIALFDVRTNATGQITGWYIDLGSGADNYMWTYDDLSQTPWAQDGSQLENVFPHNGGGAINNDPGSWSSAAPEPSSVILMPPALLAIAFVARKRVRMRLR